MVNSQFLILLRNIDWTAFIERAYYYFTANDVKSDKKKCAHLFSGCGPETYQTVISRHHQLLCQVFTKPVNKVSSTV